MTAMPGAAPDLVPPSLIYQLKPGGRIFGDDWGWSGVRAAVERFASEENLTICHRHDKWILG